MIRDAEPSDLPLIREILTRANDAPYDISAVVEEKCFGHGVAGKPRVRIFDDAGVAVTCGKYLRLIAVDRDRRRRGIGTALLRDATARVIGAEPGNYFTPGVVDSDQATIAFLQANGCRAAAKTMNLHAGLGAPWTVGVGPAAVDRHLVEFVKREFGRAWACETERAQTAFSIPDIAFAVIEANNRGLGTFGPTGVVRHERGKGYGRVLLLAALTELHRIGYSRAIIPWTDAVDFYRQSCGAEPAHTFVTFVRS